MTVMGTLWPIGEKGARGNGQWSMANGQWSTANGQRLTSYGTSRMTHFTHYSLLITNYGMVQNHARVPLQLNEQKEQSETS